MTLKRSSAPVRISSRFVSSSEQWLLPFLLGTKIIPTSVTSGKMEESWREGGTFVQNVLDVREGMDL